MSEELVYRHRIGFDCVIPENCVARIESGNVIAIYLPDDKPWTGDGLPPVGTVCEYSCCQDEAEDFPIRHWRKGDKLEVLAVRNVYGRQVPIVFNSRHMTASALMPDFISPIRTPEQIAAEEREIAICEMMEVCNELPCRQSCADLYDAGYRKQADKS